MTTRPSALALALALTVVATACATDRENPTPPTTRSTRATLAERAAATTRPSAAALPARGDEPSMRIVEAEPWPQRTDHEATRRARSTPAYSSHRRCAASSPHPAPHP